MKDHKEYIFSYETMLTTDEPVRQHYVLVRALPYENEFQSNLRADFIHVGFDSISSSYDSFGNSICYGGSFNFHRSLMWQSYGVVRQSVYRIKNEDNPYIYSIQTPLTSYSRDISEYLLSFYFPSNLMERVLLIMDIVHNLVSYESDITSMNTTAEQVFVSRKGVCQDYANLMLCFLRYLKIPCRYVNGLISGDGKTHAWVEVLIDSYWYGFDPTHNRKIDFGYIKISHGRDVNDCPVSRGVFTGNAVQFMAVHVNVGEV
ncbi:Transglutaminase-like enzyme, putative cysteine protease [Succinivibrio dextrinosolvens DSM 3072]|uniref:Transglutaminase-like enzyme, putative cysteine protease n=1 Tax=Succinivibrio dextrinosolvens DSM 3072 TaxID=1123324 RepID=A0A1T4VRR6_9GAMM|nr:transglutaminase family protein [Succinivibrio dextrinosolvens]SKA67637.1 Transglutaminase-like enzyme, putative cysteine protease [Succinivibrio dextrinosolvens DSM 3072]